jgi:hypothetical protein
VNYREYVAGRSGWTRIVEASHMTTFQFFTAAPTILLQCAVREDDMRRERQRHVPRAVIAKLRQVESGA